MNIYQTIRRKELEVELEDVAPLLTVWPRLISSHPSLNNQPAAAALERNLVSCDQIALEGPAGSGKTVLSLFLAINGRGAQFAYLEAQRWAPAQRKDNRLSEFLLTAGCDYDAATKALERGELVLILDAIDEAPWRAGGTDVADALAELSDEINGKAGLLVTSRTHETIPPFEALSATAALGGIHPDDIEAFLAQYAGGRTGVSDLVDRLQTMPFREAIKYSPLILRRLAEGLSIEQTPDNLVELFEKMADFYITRECSKPDAASTPGTWQAAYANESKHRNLINALVFSSPPSGHTIQEEQFKAVVQEMLQPRILGARALVEISTLMAEHPLVTVRYRPEKSGQDAYLVTCSHDWVRTALFPNFLSANCFDSQYYVYEIWHNGLPHPEDFLPAWDYLGDRTSTILDALVKLASTPEQATRLSQWLAVQLFSNGETTQAGTNLFSTLAHVAYMVVPHHSSITEYLNLQEVVGGPLLVKETALKLDQPNQLANLSGVTFDSVEFLIEKDASPALTLRNCHFRQTKMIIQGTKSIELVGCFLQSLEMVADTQTTVRLDSCTYDPGICVFPKNVLGLDSCEQVSVAEAFYQTYALVEVLRRLVASFNPSRPQFAAKKANVAEHNIYRGAIRDMRTTAERIINIMIQHGFVVRKPTGGVKRIDPTGKFNASEAAKFITSPKLEGLGPMTKTILEELSRAA